MWQKNSTNERVGRGREVGVEQPLFGMRGLQPTYVKNVTKLLRTFLEGVKYEQGIELAIHWDCSLYNSRPYFTLITNIK